MDEWIILNPLPVRTMLYIIQHATFSLMIFAPVIKIIQSTTLTTKGNPAERLYTLYLQFICQYLKNTQVLANKTLNPGTSFLTQDSWYTQTKRLLFSGFKPSEIAHYS